jgi:alkylmercury lyase
VPRSTLGRPVCGSSPHAGDGTLRSTPHRYLVGGRTLYTWCATDTLFFTVILASDAVVESTCPATGQPIRLELTPDAVTSVSPPGVVVSQRHGGELVGNLRADVCDHGHFFASAHAAGRWSAEHPEGALLRVVDAFDQSQQACMELGWLVPGSTAS